MPIPAIRVSSISKIYRLGKKEERPATLLQAAARFAASPVRNFRRLRSLTKFDDAETAPDILWALRDVSFEIPRGEVVGIIGRNGAGKSTLLKILSRIMPPSRGHAEICGRLASLLEVGTGFHPELTGRENIYLNGAILGMRAAEITRKFDEIVAFSEIEKFIDTPVKRYSSGMYVRLAFAVAAHLEPEILIVDEVLAVGDAAFQQKCLGKMKAASRSDGRTVLFVSHNMAAMKSLCSSVIWLKDGAIAQSGNCNEVVDSYLRESRTSASPVIDLSGFDRQNGGSPQFMLTEIRFLSGLPIFHTEALSVQVGFAAGADIEEVSVGLGFSSLDGVRLLTYESDDPGQRFAVKKGERYTMKFTVDAFPLPPGLYSINLGARSGPMFGIDYLPSVTQVDVVSGKGTQTHQAKGGAGVRLPSKWINS